MSDIGCGYFLERHRQGCSDRARSQRFRAGFICRQIAGQGMDKNGPTAVMLSATKFDHLKTGGTLLNQKFSPEFFKDDDAIQKVVKLVRSYFRLDGHHIQFNVVSADTLRDAQKHPEKYQDLIVRVAGYSDYFNDLGTDLQNEIIRRTAHEAC